MVGEEKTEYQCLDLDELGAMPHADDPVRRDKYAAIRNELVRLQNIYCAGRARIFFFRPTAVADVMGTWLTHFHKTFPRICRPCRRSPLAHSGKKRSALGQEPAAQRAAKAGARDCDV